MPDTIENQKSLEELKQQAIGSLKDWLEAELTAGKSPYVLMAEAQQAFQEAFA